MFHPLHQIFRQEGLPWQESDIKYFIERYLREYMKTEQLYCERVQGGRAVVRVGSPALLQAARLLEYDLQGALEKEAHYRLKNLKIYTAV